MHIIPLTQNHAATAARLHIDGQPGTFLTSLGHDVLTVLYQALPQSPVGFGFAAVADISKAPNQPAGFVSATTSIGKLLVEMGTKRFLQFLPPLLKRYVQQPALAFRSIQTVIYPFLVGGSSTETQQQTGKSSETETAAELLSIMVEPEHRSSGIGTDLIEQLFSECCERGISVLDVTVDLANDGAQRFYRRHGFAEHHQFTLYGRPMTSLRRNQP